VARLVAVVAAVGVAVALHVGFAAARTEAAGDPALLSIGTFSSPVYVTAPPGDGERVFIVEQGGSIKIVKHGTTVGTAFLNLTGPVKSGGEQGLLSLAFAPDYASSGRFYVFYTADSPSGELIVAEYRRSANPDVADPVGRIVLAIPHPTFTNHNGGQLQFGPDGYLYIATGDGGGGDDPDDNGQDLNALLGKLLRIDPRLGPNGEPYTVPGTNPFVGQAGRRPEIWSYGLRNPWRFSFDRVTGDLTVADVGQNEWEEIDFVPAGARAGGATNFGWDCFEGRHDYGNDPPWCSPRPSNHTRPVHEYDHSRGCSITGGYVVRDPELPALAGRYVYGDFCDGDIWSVVLSSPDATGDAPTGLNVESLSSFGEDACSRVYAVSRDGTVYRLYAEGSPSPATCTPTTPPPGPPPPPVPPPPPAPPPASPPPASPPPVAQPRPICRVPRVIGHRPIRARARIRRANCRVGRLRYRRAARPRGRILTQSPRPGSRRPRGARVHMTVSRGRR
jgi:glucose/arabinose dehydrogenase